MFGNLRHRCHGDLFDFQHHTYLSIVILNRIAVLFFFYFLGIRTIIFIIIIAIVQVCFRMSFVAHVLIDEWVSDFGSF